jgi:hypothetical protein
MQSIVKTIPGMKPLVNASGAELQCIPEMVIESVNQTDVDLHKELLSGVILTGTVRSYLLHKCCVDGLLR